MRLIFFIFCYLSYIIFATTNDHPHRVHNLPGAPKEPSFPLYAGFVDVDDGDQVFYVLCESIRSDPLSSPLVVWLNGGPGASSLVGFSMENGPYILQEDGTMRYNDLSWNQYANVLYIESPAGVGFSKSAKIPWVYHDEFTAETNFKVLEEFMTRYHPRYANRDFFITGESYAGAYVPHFAVEILKRAEGNETFRSMANRFRGIVMGNPGMDVPTRFLSAAMQMFAMGTIPQKFGPKLHHQWQQFQNNLDGNTREMSQDLRGKFLYLYQTINNSGAPYLYNLGVKCEDNSWHVENRNQGPECVLDKIMERYFNRREVQIAVHVISEDNTTVQWLSLNDDVFNHFAQTTDTVPTYRRILSEARDDFRILFYSGDLDLACPALHVARGTTNIAKRFGLEELENSPKTWHYLGDFGGVQTSYRIKNSKITIDVLTIRGAGHMVPINHPSRIFQVINNFLFTNGTSIDYSKKIRRRIFKHNSNSSTDIIS